MTHISWSSDFAFHFEDYLMYEHHIEIYYCHWQNLHHMSISFWYTDVHYSSWVLEARGWKSEMTKIIPQYNPYYPKSVPNLCNLIISPPKNDTILVLSKCMFLIIFSYLCNRNQIFHIGLPSTVLVFIAVVLGRRLIIESCKFMLIYWFRPNPNIDRLNQMMISRSLASLRLTWSQMFFHWHVGAPLYNICVRVSPLANSTPLYFTRELNMHV